MKCQLVNILDIWCMEIYGVQIYGNIWFLPVILFTKNQRRIPRTCQERNKSCLIDYELIKKKSTQQVHKLISILIKMYDIEAKKIVLSTYWLY